MARRRLEATAATDTQIGGLIRLRRAQLGMTQVTLADKLGVAFQQVQKYEKGTNRVAAGRLPPLAAALGVDVGYFYGLDDAAAEGDTAAATDCIVLMMTKRGAADLLTCFHAMTAPQRSAFLELGKSIADANSAIPQKDTTEPQRRTRARQNGSAGQRVVS
jgi:transcriptional regulator with XRE-family HTH domain